MTIDTWEYMTTEQLAIAAQVTQGRIRQLCRDGTLDAFKVGRDWLIRRASALAWMYSDRTRGPKKKDASRTES